MNKSVPIIPLLPPNQHGPASNLLSAQKVLKGSQMESIYPSLMLVHSFKIRF